jgi:hypothetical protein
MLLPFTQPPERPLETTQGSAMSRELNNFEESLMRAMRLEDVAQLDELLAAPTSQDAAVHFGPPDEAYELQEKAEQYLELLRFAKKRFEALIESRYLN